MIFINQSCGELFTDVIDVVRRLAGPHFLIAGNDHKNWHDVILIKCCTLQKNNSVKRIITWGLFTLQTVRHLLRHARKQHLFFVTNPPITMWIAPFFRRFYGCRYSLLIYDIYPDALLAVGILTKRSFFFNLWCKMNVFAFRGADHVITLGEGMVEAIHSQIPNQENVKILLIENWVDTDYFRPLPKLENPIIKELNLKNKFIVAYAGSFGATHGVGIIVKCAEILKNRSDIHFLIVGGGTEENIIKKLVLEKSLENLTILPFQPRETFRYIAAAPDISLILLKPSAGKSVMPSKVYTALSCGTAILAAAEHDSDLSRLVERYSCGIITGPEDAKDMAENLLLLVKNSDYLSQLKHNAREAAVKDFDKKTQSAKYFDLLKNF